jgi:hypothetical protein
VRPQLLLNGVLLRLLLLTLDEHTRQVLQIRS